MARLFSRPFMRYVRHLLTGLALAAAATAAGAEVGAVPVHPALNDRFYFGVGASVPKTSTDVQLDSRLGIGAAIDFERTLGMEESKTVPSALGRIRLGQRWRLEAEWFELDRGATRTIEREIRFGDRVYPLSAQVSSRMDFSDLRLSAGYSFFRTPDKELGAALGVHVAAYEVALDAPLVGAESEDVTAPLPVLSVYGQFALTGRWAVGSRLDRFSLSYDKYDGSLTSLAFDLSYQPFRHVGFGLGYRALFLSLTATENGRVLRFRQSFQGPLFFVNVSF
jgi:hypothetical protein